MVGGELTPVWLSDAYRHGIFPWPLGGEDEPVTWWSPDPRAIVELHEFRVSRRLRRTCRTGPFEVTCNRAFDRVIAGCATAGDRQGATWITPRMRAAYSRLHALGRAHSVEVWSAGRLAGGLYGVAQDGLFAAESMFHVVRDASKVALVRLVAHLAARGYRLLDIQQWTPHLGRFGAGEIPRAVYLRRLAAALEVPVTFGDRLEE